MKDSAPQLQYLESDWGTVLAYREFGHPEGDAVFLEHGMSGSSRGPHPRGIHLYRSGVRLIALDRPGYGESKRREGHMVVDGAQDVRAIADHLGIERFSVVGRSGGGPYALACAAILGPRVIKTLVMVGTAPHFMEESWRGDMVASNATLYDADKDGIIADIEKRYREVKEDPRSLLDMLLASGELEHSDLRVINDRALRSKIERSYQEAVKYGPGGWIDNALALKNGWGFDLSQIDTSVAPVELWAGGADRIVPTAHTHMIASQISGPVTITIDAELGHFGAMEQLPAYLYGHLGSKALL